MSTIGFMGGTGSEGQGLALRFAIAGEHILIGSRTEDRAIKVANKLRESISPLDHLKIDGHTNTSVANIADIVFLTIPYIAQKEILLDLSTKLKGKIVVSTVVPVEFKQKVAIAKSVPDGSASQEAQRLLPHSILIGAFQTISAKDLLDYKSGIDSDVIVCGDDIHAKSFVMNLAEKVEGVRAFNGGGLSNSRHVENLTILLLSINSNHKIRTGIKLTGI